MSAAIAALGRSLAYGHERVHMISDPAVGLQAVIAIHSTTLGPALGGLRIRAYEHGVPEALDDALRLSRAMTMKAAASGLALGGGKAVVLDRGDPDRRSERLVAMAQEIQRLGGAYITAEDIGTSTGDMDLVAQHTSFVVGRSRDDEYGGDPSPLTARTVFGAIRAAVSVARGDDDLNGRIVTVIGLGKVGAPLARMLLQSGARVVGFDPRDDVAAAMRREGVEPADGLIAALAHEADVLAPCATGGMIDRAVAAALPAAIVCGAANNPLADDGAAAVLAERGVLYVPDFLANCGGLVYADAQRRGETDPAAIDRVLDEAVARTAAVIEEARASGRLPAAVAEEHALARLRAGRAEPTTSGGT